MTGVPFVWAGQVAPPWVRLPRRRPGNDCAIVTIAALTSVTYAQATIDAVAYGWTAEVGMGMEGMRRALTARRPTGRRLTYPRSADTAGLVGFLSARPRWTGALSVATNTGDHVCPVTVGWVWNLPNGGNPPVNAGLAVRWHAFPLPSIRDLEPPDGRSVASVP